jgi:hypothetical protein
MDRGNIYTTGHQVQALLINKVREIREIPMLHQMKSRLKK